MTDAAIGLQQRRYMITQNRQRGYEKKPYPLEDFIVSSEKRVRFVFCRNTEARTWELLVTRLRDVLAEKDPSMGALLVSTFAFRAANDCDYT